jgi:hypothetical protein
MQSDPAFDHLQARPRLPTASVYFVDSPQRCFKSLSVNKLLRNRAGF